MRTRCWGAMVLGLVLSAGACDGGAGAADDRAGDLPVAIDSGGDRGPGDPGTQPDTAADPAPDPAPDPASGDPSTVDPATADATADDPGTPHDRGTTDDTDATDATADPGTAPDPGGVDTFVPCFLGQVECFGGAAGEDGKTCATATVVSRWVASNDGVLANPSNEETDNNDDLPTSAGTGCKDGGNDLYYRVYLKAGETLSLLLAYHPTIDMMAKIYRGTDCADASLSRCVDENVDGPTVGSNPPLDTEAEVASFVADAEGWYTVVLDGRTSDDLGRHMVRFNLFNCGDVDCCCY